MSYQRGEHLIYFKVTHPRQKLDAVFVDESKTRVRITIQDPNKGSRTILVPHDCVERPRPPLPGADLFQAAPGGFRGAQ